MTLPLLVGLLAGLVVGGGPLLGLLRRQSRLRALVRASPGPREVPDPDELTPNELAYLAGGAVRVAETAITDAFLAGRIRRQNVNGFFTVVGPGKPQAHEKDFARRVLVKAFRKRVGVSAREVVRRVVTSAGVGTLRASLAKDRLTVDSAEVRRLLEARVRAPKVIRRWRFLSLAVAVVGAGLYFATGPGAAAVGALAGGLTASALLVVARAVFLSGGGATVRPTTAAGEEVLALARERYAATSAQSTGEMTHDQAVRHTAVTGFRTLRAAAPSRSASRSVSGQGSAEYSPALTTADTGGGAGGWGGTGTVHPDSLCELADLCQNGSSSHGGSDGDGWGGSGGDSGWSGSGGDSGGGWGGWGGDGGSGGGGDSGGGGGDGGGGGGGGD